MNKSCLAVPLTLKNVATQLLDNVVYNNRKTVTQNICFFEEKRIVWMETAVPLCTLFFKHFYCFLYIDLFSVL